MTSYQVTARRWAKGWELHIAGDAGMLGVTQCRTLAGAEFMARDYVSRSLEVPAGSFGLDLAVDLGGQVLGAPAVRELAALERQWRGRVARVLDRVRDGWAR